MLYNVRDLQKDEFLIIRKIEVDDTGSGLHFYGEIPQRYAAMCFFTKMKFKKKKVDFQKVISETKTQEQLESLLNKTVYPCFVKGKCVGYKMEVNRCETIES